MAQRIRAVVVQDLSLILRNHMKVRGVRREPTVSPHSPVSAHG